MEKSGSILQCFVNFSLSFCIFCNKTVEIGDESITADGHVHVKSTPFSRVSFLILLQSWLAGWLAGKHTNAGENVYLVT